MRATILALALLLPLQGCAVPPMSPEAQAAYDQAVQEAQSAKQAERDAKRAVSQAKTQAEALQRQIGELRTATPTPESQAAIAGILGQVTALQEQVDKAAVARTQAEQARKAAEAKAQELERQALADQGGAILNVLGDFFPPLKPFLPSSDMWLLLAGLFFDRPREHALNALQGTLSGVVEAVKLKPAKAGQDLLFGVHSVLASVGLEHTTNDPNQLLSNAASVAASKGLTVQEAQAAFSKAMEQAAAKGVA